MATVFSITTEDWVKSRGGFFQLINDERSGQVEIPENYNQLHDIMQLIKGDTDYYINLYLKRKGKFWQRDSFDRFMRDEKELYNTVNYIIRNPIKTGLVQNWNDWPHTRFAFEFHIENLRLSHRTNRSWSPTARL